jgi:hypothetical protein
MSIELWPEQKPAWKWGKRKNRIAYFCEQRTGKTFLTLQHLWHAAGDPINLRTGEGNDFCGILITLLANKETSWLKNIEEQIPWLNVTMDWEEFKKLPCPRLLLVHFDKVRNIRSKLARYKKFNWITVDEAHRMGNRGSGQSRAIQSLSWIERKILLTGTPIEKNESQLFTLFKFLAPEVFGTHWDSFLDEWFEFDQVDIPDKLSRKSPQYQRLLTLNRIMRKKATFIEEYREEFNELIEPFAYRLTKEDVGIKRAEVEVVPITLSKTGKTLHDKMKKTSVIHVEGKRIMADMPAISIMKQRQLASGFVIDEEKEVYVTDDAKIRYLRKALRSSYKPVVLFAAFIPDIHRLEQLCRDLELDFEVYYGSTHKRSRPGILEAFQRCQYDVLICQIRTGGVGVDLWRANTAYVYSMTHSFIDWDQMVSRLDHKSKDQGPWVGVLCSIGTIDEDLFNLVVQKKFTSEEVMKHLTKTRRIPMAKKPEKKPTAPKTVDGYTLADLAADHKMSTVKARDILRRDKKVKKPGTQWVWPTKKAAGESGAVDALKNYQPAPRGAPKKAAKKPAKKPAAKKAKPAKEKEVA